MDHTSGPPRRGVLFGGAALVAGAMVPPERAQAKAISSVRPPVLEIPFPNLPTQGSINDRADAYGETALTLSRMAALTTQCLRDIAYGSEPEQRLDIYLPSGSAGGSRPVFINIHGGAWRWGYKEWMGLNAPPIVGAGAIYVSIEYRLAPGARHPAQLDDCTRALTWVVRNIAKYDGDPNRIYIGGHSAGAHLASLIALRRDRLPNFGLPEDVIKGCLLASGAYDFRDPSAYGLPSKNAFLDDFLSTPGDARDASPIVWTDGNRIPFFVSWGENDRDDAKLTAPAFVDALRRQPGHCDAHMFPLLDHFWMHIAQQSSANLWTKTAIAWLQGGGPPQIKM